jgi:hypothetical protein
MESGSEPKWTPNCVVDYTAIPRDVFDTENMWQILHRVKVVATIHIGKDQFVFEDEFSLQDCTVDRAIQNVKDKMPSVLEDLGAQRLLGKI